jgi:hypothetical protein
LAESSGYDGGELRDLLRIVSKQLDEMEKGMA